MRISPRETIYIASLLIQVAGRSIVTHAPDASFWWAGHLMQDIGTAGMGVMVVRDVRNIKRKAPEKP